MKSIVKSIFANPHNRKDLTNTQEVLSQAKKVYIFILAIVVFVWVFRIIKNLNL